VVVLSVLVVARLRLLLRGCAALLSVVSFRGSPPGGLFWSSFAFRFWRVWFASFLRSFGFGRLPFVPSVPLFVLCGSVGSSWGFLEGCLMTSSVSGSVPVFVPFVPSASAVSLGRSGFASSVVPVRGLGFSGGVVSRSAWVSGSVSAPVFLPSRVGASALWVWFAGSSAPLVCLVGALSSADLSSLVASASSAASSGSPVFPVVAAGASGVAASGYFCGLSASGPGSSAVPAVGSFAS
jgi:hypothetical protein